MLLGSSVANSEEFESIPSVRLKSIDAKVIQIGTDIPGKPSIQIRRFVDEDNMVACYVTEAGGISCLPSETHSMQVAVSKSLFKAIDNPTKENISNYQKLQEEAKTKALRFAEKVEEYTVENEENSEED